jgi:hypothetical protein
MARLRGASGVVRPTRIIRSFAIVCGATIASAPSLLLRRFVLDSSRKFRSSEVIP